MDMGLAAVIPDVRVVNTLIKAMDLKKTYRALKDYRYNPTPANRQKAEEYLHTGMQIMHELLRYTPVDPDSRKMFRFESVAEIFEYVFDKKIFPGAKGIKMMQEAVNEQLGSCSNQRELVYRYSEDVQKRNSRKISFPREAEVVGTYFLAAFRSK